MPEHSPLSYIAVWAPAISAVIVCLLREGPKGLVRFFGRILFTWPSWPWLLVVVLGVPLLILLAGFLTELQGQEWISFVPFSVGAFTVAALWTLTLGPMEEIGWRGFALPLLQRSFAGLGAAAFLGFVWALWHLPAMFVQSVMTGAIDGSTAVVVVRLFIGIIAKSIIIAGLYNITGGSVALIILYHWLGNVHWPWESTGGISVFQDIFDIAIALIMVTVFRRRLFSPEALQTGILSNNR